jgi:hypothetical protein
MISNAAGSNKVSAAASALEGGRHHGELLQHSNTAGNGFTSQ